MGLPVYSSLYTTTSESLPWIVLRHVSTGSDTIEHSRYPSLDRCQYRALTFLRLPETLHRSERSAQAEGQ